MPKRSKSSPIGKEGLQRLSDFRWELRRFLRFSEDAARDAGITVLQYQLMLHTQGFAGRDWATVGELAERLQAQHHGVVALVGRCEEAGLVWRCQNDEDRRLVEVHLQERGRALLVMLAAKHQSELGRIRSVLAGSDQQGS